MYASLCYYSNFALQSVSVRLSFFCLRADPGDGFSPDSDMDVIVSVFFIRIIYFIHFMHFIKFFQALQRRFYHGAIFFFSADLATTCTGDDGIIQLAINKELVVLVIFIFPYTFSRSIVNLQIAYKKKRPNMKVSL